LLLQTTMQQLNELLDSGDPAWPLVQAWLREARNAIEVLPAQQPDRSDALVALQVTTRSTMGAIVYETGGLLVDRGWLRILGSGHARLPRSLPYWNASRTSFGRGDAPDDLLIGDDVLGGFFAINGGALSVTLGNVCYYAPDRLEWEDLGRGYTEFIRWCLAGDLGAFYEGYRWPGWENEIAGIGGDQAYSLYPPLWAEGPAIRERDRRLVPIAELFAMYLGGDT
jgi:Protein of unknown function DUF2625